MTAPAGESQGLKGEKPVKIPITAYFTRPFFLSLTIGVPFCLFKILFGIQFIRASGLHDEILFIYAGGFLIVWAGADMFMNLVRAGYDCIGQGDRIEFCTLAQVGRTLGVPTLFLSLDTLITFTIICMALWSGWIVLLSQVEAALWYSATTINLISLSLVSLLNEIGRRRYQTEGN